MKGLLLKDWYVLRKAVALYAVCCAAMQLAPGSGSFLCVLYAALLPASAFAYDDHSRWGELAAMLPYSVRDIVLSRYIIGWAGTFVLNLLSVCFQAVFAMALPQYRERLIFQGVSGFLLMLGFSVLFLALTLPIYFRFDAEKSRMVRLMSIALCAGAIGAITAVSGVEHRWTGSPWDEAAVWGGVCAAAVLVTAGSIPLSMLAYQARRK